jgi:uncharacterized protein (DUF1330 family)
MTPGPVEPGKEQLAALAAVAGGPDDGPVVMLNLNRYRERALYEADPPGGGTRDVSGREAYERYGEVALEVLERVGAKILWHTEVQGTVIGDAASEFDEVIAVWYPSLTAFVSLATAPEVLVARADRIAGLERAALIRCASGPEPELPA